LATRSFNRQIFERCSPDLGHTWLDGATLDWICGPADNPRMLVQQVDIDPTCNFPETARNPDDVLVQLFVAFDSKLGEDRVFIEASGPWSRVTWLECTLMQAVYDVLWRDKMRQRFGQGGKWDDIDWYPKWLAEAFVRCVRALTAAKRSGLKGMLFSGRRTGGLALVNLQSMFLSQCFKDSSGNSMCLGMSSVYSHYSLVDAGVKREYIPKLAGTHGHELSMVLFAVLGELDERVGVPVSQVIAHLMYFFCSMPRGRDKSLMSMLPDTLGTACFLKMASLLQVPLGAYRGKPVLECFGSARQDSGDLSAFAALMKQYHYPGELMCSEIEGADDLSEAARYGYSQFCAGGFFGDAEHSWDSSVVNLNMSCKVVRVHLGQAQFGKGRGGLPRMPYPPVKAADSANSSKFEADGLLSADDLAALRARVRRLQEGELKVSPVDFQRLFHEAFSEMTGLSEDSEIFMPFVVALRQRVVRAGGDNGDPMSEASAAALALKFVEEHRGDVERALEFFGADGRARDGLPMPASSFNDFYKFTMLPVMNATENARPGGVRCTFSVNVRDKAYRQSLVDSARGRSSPALLDTLRKELVGLTTRPFDRATFERCKADWGLVGFDEGTLDWICGPRGDPRMLAQHADVDLDCRSPKDPRNDVDVLVQLFVANDCKINEERVYIEATGPWSRVTWLETSMMQAVYDALFRDKMRQRYGAKPDKSGNWNDSTWYPKWLAAAFVRCAQSLGAVQKSGLKGALFTGRRTGGLPLMNLQGMFLQKYFRDADGNSKLLGTSSVTSHYHLVDAGVNRTLIPRPAGTHAHELSMVLFSVLGELDDQAGVPLSQLIGHMMYFFLSMPRGDVKESGRKALMPMLPDTLGTDIFMKMARLLKVPYGKHKGEPVLDIIGAARQDSGTLANFAALMKRDKFSGGLMASEIEKAEDLFEAAKNGYAYFGAGGFFGDSEHAWDSSISNISMAVKVLRVHVDGQLRKYYPTKTGDDPTGSKFEADGLISKDSMAALRERVKLLQEGNLKVSDLEFQRLFAGTLADMIGTREVPPSALVIYGAGSEAANGTYGLQEAKMLGDRHVYQHRENARYEVYFSEELDVWALGNLLDETLYRANGRRDWTVPLHASWSSFHGKGVLPPPFVEVEVPKPVFSAPPPVQEAGVSLVVPRRHQKLEIVPVSPQAPSAARAVAEKQHQGARLVRLEMPTNTVNSHERWWEPYAPHLSKLKGMLLTREATRDELANLSLTHLLHQGLQGKAILDADGNADASLSWGEVLGLVCLFFTRNGLDAPRLSDRAWFFAWTRHERDNRSRVSIGHASDFVLLFIEDVTGLLEGDAWPLAPEPGTYASTFTHTGMNWHAAYQQHLRPIAGLLARLAGEKIGEDSPPRKVLCNESLMSMAVALGTNGCGEHGIPSELIRRLREIFDGVDVNVKESLSWSGSQVRYFVTAVFRAHNSDPSWSCETDWHQLMVRYCQSQSGEHKQMAGITPHGASCRKGTAHRKECTNFALFALKAHGVHDAKMEVVDWVFSSMCNFGFEELEWHKCEASLFVRRVYGSFGLPSALVPHEWWYLIYRDVDKDAAYELTFDGAIEYLKLTLYRILLLNGADCNGVVEDLRAHNLKPDDDSRRESTLSEMWLGGEQN